MKIKVVCYNIEKLKGMDYLNTLPNIDLTKKGIDILEEIGILSFLLYNIFIDKEELYEITKLRWNN